MSVTVVKHGVTPGFCATEFFTVDFAAGDTSGSIATGLKQVIGGVVTPTGTLAATGTINHGGGLLWGTAFAGTQTGTAAGGMSVSGTVGVYRNPAGSALGHTFSVILFGT